MSAADHTYRGWHIRHDPPPFPVRNCDWQFWHDDFDGAPLHSGDLGSADNRCGSAESLEAAKAEIDEHEGGPIHPALENLRACQRQLDAGGSVVGVSRQAVDETLTIAHSLLAALRQVMHFEIAHVGPYSFEAIQAAHAAIAQAEGRA